MFMVCRMVRFCMKVLSLLVVISLFGMLMMKVLLW